MGRLAARGQRPRRVGQFGRRSPQPPASASGNNRRPRLADSAGEPLLLCIGDRLKRKATTRGCWGRQRGSGAGCAPCLCKAVSNDDSDAGASHARNRLQSDRDDVGHRRVCSALLRFVGPCSAKRLDVASLADASCGSSGQPSLHEADAPAGEVAWATSKSTWRRRCLLCGVRWQHPSSGYPQLGAAKRNGDPPRRRGFRHSDVRQRTVAGPQIEYARRCGRGVGKRRVRAAGRRTHGAAASGWDV